MDFHVIIIITTTTTGITVLDMPQEGSTYDHTTPADCCAKQDGKITCSQHKNTFPSYIVKQEAVSALEELPFHC